MQMFIVRHGETDWNAERRVQGQSESSLNDKGREQAAALKPWIESVGFDAVYTSSSQRTIQTAEILTGNMDLPLQKRDDIREICLGPWEQLLWSDIEQSSSSEVTNFREFPHLFNLEGAETFGEVRQRGMRALHEIAQQHDDMQAKLLVVSHGALISAVLSGLASVCLSRLWKNPSLPNCSVSEISITKPTGRASRADGAMSNERCLQVVSVAGIPLHDSPWFEVS